MPINDRISPHGREDRGLGFQPDERSCDSRSPVVACSVKGSKIPASSTWTFFALRIRGEMPAAFFKHKVN